MEIETERLILRTPVLGDLEEVVVGLNDINISKNLSSVSYPYSMEEGEEWINMAIKKLGNNSAYSFVIRLKENDSFAGVVEIFDIDVANNVGETRSWIKKEFQRKGYMTEAKKYLFDFAFNDLKLRKLDSGVFVSNVISNKISYKLGFKLEGTKRKAVVCKATEVIHDMHMYGLFKDEWEAKCD